jgi:hypothetical protein
MTPKEEQAAIVGAMSPLPADADDLSATSGNGYPEGMAAGTATGELPGLYAQAQATRQQSQLLAIQLRECQRKAMENWQLIQAAWERAHEIHTLRSATRSDKDRLRRSAYARVQAKLATLPVIEQAKGIIMAQCGWPEEQAFDALRRASQRENVKVRDLAARIVAAAASKPAQPQAGSAMTTALLSSTSSPSAVSRRTPAKSRRVSA